MKRLNGLIIETRNPLSEARARLENKLSPFRRESLAWTEISLPSSMSRLGSLSINVNGNARMRHVNNAPNVTASDVHCTG